MPICVISTTGTSVFTNASKPIYEAFRSLPSIDDIQTLRSILTGSDFPEQNLYLRTLEYLRSEAKGTDSVDNVRRASAELNSLSHILGEHRNRSDQLHFLVSATTEGALAGRVIADFASEHFKVENIACHVIEGLQVDNGKEFQQNGVRNLISKVYDALKKAPAGTYTRVINPTGGFKGVVPYLTLIGMIEPAVQLSYIYEKSPELISLGRVPLQFDYDVLYSAYEALEAASRDFVIAQQLLSLLGLPDQDALISHPSWPLFAQTPQGDETYFSVNGLGLIVLEHFRLNNQRAIYLSSQAYQKYENLDKNLKDQLSRIFRSMRNEDWVKINLHGTGKDRLKILKPSGAERPLFYYQDDGSLVIADIGLKNDGSYTRISNELDVMKRSDFPAFKLWTES